MAKCGIYTITNILNGKIYIGRSVNVLNRLSAHRSELRKNMHHCSHLQGAWLKYGEKGFIFEILLECEESFLYSEEHYWANMLNVHNENFGYNTAPTHPYGNPRSAESTKAKISAKNKGKKLKGEWRERFSKMWIGRTHSEETKKKISDSKIKQKVKLSQETKDKISTFFKGRTYSEETIQKMRDSAKKLWQTSERRTKDKLSKTGRILSEETKRRISDSLKKRNIRLKTSLTFN